MTITSTTSPPAATTHQTHSHVYLLWEPRGIHYEYAGPPGPTENAIRQNVVDLCTEIQKFANAALDEGIFADIVLPHEEPNIIPTATIVQVLNARLQAFPITAARAEAAIAARGPRLEGLDLPDPHEEPTEYPMVLSVEEDSVLRSRDYYRENAELKCCPENLVLLAGGQRLEAALNDRDGGTTLRFRLSFKMEL